jgi:hypothetical protein
VKGRGMWIFPGVVLLIVAGCGLGLVLFIHKMLGLEGEVDAAKAHFLRQVGDEYDSMPIVGSKPTSQETTPQGTFTRSFEICHEGRARVTARSRKLETQQHPRASFQLTDKKLVGNLRSFLDLAGPVKRTLSIVYPGPHPAGDAEPDASFVPYATDVPAASAVLREPEVKKALLDLASVSRIVDSSGASFADPGDSDVYASGASRVDPSPAPAIRSATRVHLAVEQILNRVAGARS